MKKAIFFDIDGTIWDMDNFIPESTKKAFRLLKENGHLIFLNSGRSRAFIREPGLFELDFDGIISGCGTIIEYQGERIFYKQIERELAIHTMETIRKYGFRPILEGWEYLYLEEEDFSEDEYGQKVMAEMGEKLLGIMENWGNWEISKLSCATKDADQEGCFAALKEHYDYIVHNPAVVEIVPKGFDKSTGILKVCELLDVDIANTYAFGDSVNDLGMFSVVGTAIAMGDGTSEAKEAADFVTDSLYEDGIWKACKKLGLF